MKILGIDPGTICLGYGLLEIKNSKISPAKTVRYGAIYGGKGSIPTRLKIIYSSLTKVIKQQKPSHIAIENIFYSKDVRATIRMGEGRGIVLLAAANSGAKIFEYTPAEIKKAVTGNGRADKQQVQHMVSIILGLEKLPEPTDAADALAVAICHYNRI